VTAAVNLINVLNILVKLQAIAAVNPELFTIIQSRATDLSQAIDQVFTTAPSLKDTMDVRGISNINSILSTYGLPNNAALINFASLINLSLVFNQLFVQIVQGLLPALATVITSVVVLVNNILITVSALLNTVLVTVIGLLGGVVATLNGLIGTIVYPTLSQVVNVGFPTVQSLVTSTTSNSLASPITQYIAPTPALTKALPIYQMLNCVA
jgi:hypothetical protein